MCEFTLNYTLFQRKIAIREALLKKVNQKSF